MWYINSIRKVLLTNYKIKTYSGSEIDTLTIADFFIKKGAIVYVATFQLDNPMKEIFSSHGIIVVNVLLQTIDIKEFDLVWGHHFPVLDYCILNEKIKSKYIIYQSLSPYEPYEAPPLYANKLDLIIANSIETSQQLTKEGINKSKILVFPNSATNEFFESYSSEGKRCLKKIGIISNHVADEVLEASKKMNKLGYMVDIIGERGESILVIPEILKKYDLIITIGKTIQFCFAMGIPVYCYDIYGGPGYLNQNNFILAEYNNFSGRGFDRKLSCDVLISDIIDGYSTNLEYIKNLREYSLINFSFEKNINLILNKLCKYKFLRQIKIEHLKRHIMLFAREFQSHLEDINKYEVILNDREKAQEIMEFQCKELERLKLDFQILLEDRKKAQEIMEMQEEKIKAEKKKNDSNF